VLVYLVILNAFARQLWLRERATVLRYTHISSLVLLSSLCFSNIKIRNQNNVYWQKKT